MSQVSDFLQKCMNLPTGNHFFFFIEESVAKLKGVNFETEQKEVTHFLRQTDKAGGLNQIASGLMKCIEFCQQRKENSSEASSNADYMAFGQLLLHLWNLVDFVGKSQEDDDEHQDFSDLTGMRTALESYDAKIKEFQSKLLKVDASIEKQTERIDDRTFQLLVNTVSILGIFVAIAIAGFGGISIVNNINLSEDFIRGVFAVFLVATFAYNLLFMLLYFIVAILRGFGQKEQREEDRIKLRPFVIIDLVLLFVTVALFVAKLLLTGN